MRVVTWNACDFPIPVASDNLRVLLAVANCDFAGAPGLCQDLQSSNRLTGRSTRAI